MVVNVLGKLRRGQDCKTTVAVTSPELLLRVRRSVATAQRQEELALVCPYY